MAQGVKLVASGTNVIIRLELAGPPQTPWEERD